MTTSEKEEPLDPAVEKIRVKMVRLLMVSGGIMMLGLMAVLAAIVYKVTRPAPGQQAAGSAQVVATISDIAIPKGAKLISSAGLNGDIMLTLQLQSGQTVIRRYNTSGQLVASYSIIEN